jgi:hypothetical protein
MATFEEDVRAFVALVTSGDSLGAIDRFYADDVALYENYAAPRVGKAANRAHEAKMLGALAAPLQIEARAVTCDAAAGVSMVEWCITFTAKGQPTRRLEEVAVQRWRDRRIVSERFYYEKMVEG